MKKTIIFILAFLAIFNISKAQNSPENRTDNKIFVLARNYGDSIVIRWAPNNPVLWLLCNKSGYRLERVYRELVGPEDNKQMKERYEPVRSEVFKPLSMEAMIERYKDEKHPQGMIAAQFLYGEVNLTGEQVGMVAAIKAQEDEQNMRFTYTLLAADLDPNVADALGLRYSFSIKGSHDSLFSFRLVPLLDTSVIKVSTVYFSIDRNYVDTIVYSPRGVYTESEDKGTKLYWQRGDGLSAYFIERSTDGVYFTQLNKAPYLTSSSTADDLKKQYPFSDKQDTSIRGSIPIPLDLYNFYLDALPDNYTKYYYRVYGIDAFGDTSKYSIVVSNKGTEEINLQPPSDVKAQIIGKNKIKITWKEPKDKRNLKGYVLAYATAFAQEQHTVLHKDLLKPGTTEFIHSSANEGSNNIYYLSAIDDKGRSSDALHTQAYINDTVAPAPPKGINAVIDTNGICLISWKFNDEADIAGYKVYFSRHKNGMYNQLTENTIETNMFIDKIDLNMLNNKIYYKVVAIDKAGNHSDYSAPCTALVPDIIPPSTPVVNKYFISSNEISIQYITGNDNDMSKHYITRREKGGEWKVIKTIADKNIKNHTIDFKDSIAEGDIVYEYAAQSEDMVGLRSELSQIIPAKIDKRTLNPIIMKIESKFIPSENKVNLKWKKPDLTGNFHYVLYKKTAENNWKILNSFDSNVTEYNDGEVAKQSSYTYKVVPFAEGAEIGSGEQITVLIP